MTSTTGAHVKVQLFFFVVVIVVVIVVIVIEVAVVLESMRSRIRPIEVPQEQIICFSNALKLSSSIGITWIFVWMCPERNLGKSGHFIFVR
jgi:hypothetical protein